MSNPRKYIAKRDRVDAADLELTEKVVFINRVAKVMQGGRRFHFTAIVVVGDTAGRVGAAMGKATEVPEAIRKAGTIARKHMISVPLNGTPIPHPLLDEVVAGPERPELLERGPVLARMLQTHLGEDRRHGAGADQPLGGDAVRCRAAPEEASIGG